jgi:two-component system LytT family response regulator
MKIVIIDDNASAIEALMIKLALYADAELSGTAMNGTNGLAIVNKVKPDLLFLDVELPDMSGLDFLEQMQKSSAADCHIVIYTSHDKYMLRSFRNGAFDFLLKPFEQEELDAVMQRFYMKRPSANVDMKDVGIKRQNEDKLLFYLNTVDFRLVNVKDIGLFQYNHELRVWEVVIAGSKNPVRLKRNANNDVLVKINPSFVQVHQRYIININYLMDVTDNVCHFYPPFDDLEYVKVGRLYRKKLLDIFENI